MSLYMQKNKKKNKTKEPPPSRDSCYGVNHGVLRSLGETAK